MNENTLFTHAPSGLYQVNYLDFEITDRLSTKTGNEYQRLTIRFKVIQGPLAWDGQAWGGQGNNFGKTLGLWHELTDDGSGGRGISPNWWLSSSIMQAAGTGIDKKLKNWGATVNWVVVTKKNGRPAHITGVSSQKDAPDNTWVTGIIGQ